MRRWHHPPQLSTALPWQLGHGWIGMGLGLQRGNILVVAGENDM